jgi:dual specificity MAP kinase phosphatase
MDVDVDEQGQTPGQAHADVEISVEVDPARPTVWGMPKWGWEEERKEVRKGVRLVGMEEVSADLDFASSRMLAKLIVALVAGVD